MTCTFRLALCEISYFLLSLVCIAAVHKPTLFVTRDELKPKDGREGRKMMLDIFPAEVSPPEKVRSSFTHVARKLG